MKALLMMLFGIAIAHAQSGPTFGAPYRFTEPGGQAIYASVCAGCHMPNGRGAAGAGAYPSLVADPRLEDAGYPVGLVLHGHGGMPGFARMLSDAQIAAVVTYIRGNFGNAYGNPPAAADVAASR